jgi:Ca2+-binding RTX toxin-like protein
MAVRGAKRAGSRRLLRGGFAACAAAVACAAPAGAATVANTHDPAVAPGGVSYAAAVGEVNRLTVSGDGTNVLLGDAVAIAPVAPPVAVPPDVQLVDDCVAPTAFTATCPLGAVTVALDDQNDTITMGAGAPAVNVNGGAGNDVLIDPVLSPGTVFDGDLGVDRTDYSARVDPVSVSMNGVADDGAPGEGDDIAGDEVVGGAGDDTIGGNTGANSLVGGAGTDFISGDAGADVLDGGAGNDTLDGGTENDTLRGGDGADQLIGGAGADLLVGGPGPDAISGGDGNDTISAADGVAETIDCGAGIDTVVADLGAGGATDTRVGCENVTGPAAPPAPAPAPPPAGRARARLRAPGRLHRGLRRVGRAVDGAHRGAPARPRRPGLAGGRRHRDRAPHRGRAASHPREVHAPGQDGASPRAARDDDGSGARQRCQRQRGPADPARHRRAVIRVQRRRGPGILPGPRERRYREEWTGVYPRAPVFIP